PFFYPHLTAEEFLQFIARVKRVPSAELDLRVNRLLAQVCLNEERSKLTSELSQGMKKKLAIAAALIGAPDLLFLDEALNGVDVESAYQIKEGLREFTTGGGTVLLSTHVLEVIEKLCDRYVVMKKGRIIDDVRAADWKETGRSSLEEYIIERLRRLD
ncbi:MAG TPA: ATP-binding cassette domain-containing protein, partial [bacterium]|nr:ATP-binding cassette domain-containing protein [bacterium]